MKNYKGLKMKIKIVIQDWKINEYKISKVFNITKKSNQWKLAQGGTKLHPILNTWTGG